MVNVQPSQEGATVLRKPLELVAPDMRMEIGGTDDLNLKDGPKHERAVLESTLAQLSGPAGERA